MPRAKKKPDLGHIADQLRPLAVEVSTLVEDPANARLHPTRNMEAITASLRRFGQRKPVVVRREGMIIEAGNGTLAAARALGWRHLAAVLVDDDATTATGFAIADNRTGELAEWDDAALARLLGSVKDEMPEVELGFSDEDLAALFEGVEADEDVAEDPGAGEPPAEPVSKRGEVYALGPHRLMCGDSTSAEDVAALLGGATPGLMVTDPPYGVDYDPNWRVEAAATGNIAYGATRLGEVENDDVADWSQSWELFPGAVAYVWHASLRGPVVQASLVGSGFVPRSMIVWAKSHLVISRGHYHWQHESCIYLVRKGKTASWAGARSESTLWAINQVGGAKSSTEDSVTGHGTQKPIECMERPIRNHEGDVYDPFLGSGTTLIAAARQRRRCFGLEISPAYCDVIRKRWGDWSRAQGVDPGPDAL